MYITNQLYASIFANQLYIYEVEKVAKTYIYLTYKVDGSEDIEYNHEIRRDTQFMHGSMMDYCSVKIKNIKHAYKLHKIGFNREM